MKNPLFQFMLLASATTVMMSFAPTAVFANVGACIDAFEDSSLQSISVPTVSVADQSEKRYSSDAVKAYRAYVKIETTLQSADLQIDKATRELLDDEELSSFHRSLSKILSLVSRSKAVSEAQTAEAKKVAIVKIVERYLETLMTQSMAAERAALLTSNPLDKTTLMKVLGQMTQAESVEALVGPNGIHDISSDSLVGRYLEAAKKVKGTSVSTLVSKFKSTPRSRSRGEERLFVGIDAATAKVANDIFNKNPHLLMHNHYPHQSTLQMLFNGKSITYARYDSNGELSTSRGAIIPVVALSSLEASYAHNYFTLGTLENKYAKYPWGLRDQTNPAQEERYCRFGGYASCTHWIGEMPIGEKLVSEYSFPGNVGDDPYSNDSGRGIEPNTKKLRTAPVGSFTHFTYGDSKAVGTVKRSDRLARMVWRTNKGHEQLWSMVGDTNAVGLSKGEWANPGWVLYSFLARSTSARVPVVFVVRPDTSTPMTEQELDQLRSGISAQ